MAIKIIYMPCLLGSERHDTTHLFATSGRMLLACGSLRSRKPYWATQHYPGPAMDVSISVLDAGPHSALQHWLTLPLGSLGMLDVSNSREHSMISMGVPGTTRWKGLLPLSV